MPWCPTKPPLPSKTLKYHKFRRRKRKKSTFSSFQTMGSYIFSIQTNPRLSVKMVTAPFRPIRWEIPVFLILYLWVIEVRKLAFKMWLQGAAKTATQVDRTKRGTWFQEMRWRTAIFALQNLQQISYPDLYLNVGAHKFIASWLPSQLH